MNRLDQLEAEILRRARRDYSASPSSQARVQVATLAAVSAGAVVSTADPTLLWRDVIDRVRDGLSVPRALALALALGGAGAGGYALGLRESQARKPVNATPASVAPAPVAPPATPLAEREQPQHSPGAPDPERARQPSYEPETPVPVPSAPYASPAELELSTLRRVERVLRQGNPRFALALLIELDQKVPRGSLMEERLAARTTATCQLEKSAAARNAAAAFDSRYPTSVYAARVHEACAAAEPGASERIPEPAETHMGKGESKP